ncbi:MAG: 1-acyl-sn-glycerol-3-phosphate acyltransferase [Bacteroidetes bacterium]|nr:MAG: 1-acyl-sn-glycerol-3-phosphate acyltransferase [Bacteroidota bacterium]
MNENLALNPSTTKKSKRAFRWKDPFGHIYLLKRLLIMLIGWATYRLVACVQKTDIKGLEYLHDLPAENVLFVSNHQTYFMDVIVLFHLFSAAKWGFKDLRNPLFLLWPRVQSYYVAAEETMKEGGLLPRIFTYAGAVLVKRAFRHKGQEVRRSADFRAPAKIKKALDSGWVVNFPQGTTGRNAPVRKGSANLIRALQPIVVPVKIANFDEAFEKKGLRAKKKGVPIQVVFSPPVTFEPTATVAEIQEFLEKHILPDPAKA